MLGLKTLIASGLGYKEGGHQITKSAWQALSEWISRSCQLRQLKVVSEVCFVKSFVYKVVLRAKSDVVGEHSSKLG